MQRYAGTAKLISIAVIVLSLLMLVRTLPISQLRDGLETWIDDLGVVGPIVFVLIYALATVLLLPGSVFTLAAGAIFGLWAGFLVVSVGSNVGAALAFLIARYAAREKVERMAAARPRFRAVDEAISEGGWKIVALLRLSPAIPFNVQNYLYGLTSIRFWTCVLTSWIAMIPGTFLYVYLGHLAGAAARNRSRSVGEWVLLIVGLLATIAVTVYITKLARRKLEERTAGEEPATGTNAAASESERTFAPMQVFGLALLAAVLLALAVLAQFYPDAVAGFLRRVTGEPPPETG